MRYSRVMGLGASAGLVLVLASPASARSDFSYMEPVAPGTTLDVLLTTGDKVNGVMWPGVPDGIGVLKDGKNLTVFVNHELSGSNATAVAQKRANGAASAATVSAVNIDPDAKAVTGVRDLISTIAWYDYSTGQWGSKPGAPTGAAPKDEFGTPNHSTVLNRFCSSHMAQPGALSFTTTDSSGKKVTYGYTGPAYFTGEEGGDESRAFVMSNSGVMVQLPKLGLAAWENLVPAPATGMNTVVMANEDGSATDSQLWMYVGTKTSVGGWVDRAGLTNGQLYVMAVDGVPSDSAFRAQKGKNAPVSVSWKAINTDVNGKEQNAQARALGTIMARVEDGAFDPNNPNDYYFVTTESNKDPKATTPNPASPKVPRDGGALWRLRFNDVKNPTSGATLTMLLDGSEEPYLNKPDNIDVDGAGNVLIQEDPGNNDHVSRVVAYRIKDGKIATVAKFKDVYFAPGAAQFITKDEESSGVTEVTDFMRKSETDTRRYYVLDAQVHASPLASRLDLAGADASTKAELANMVEGGQLYLMTVDDWTRVYG